MNINNNFKKIMSFILVIVMVTGLAFALNTNTYADEMKTEYQEMEDTKEENKNETPEKTASQEKAEEKTQDTTEGKTSATEGLSARGTRANITVDLADATNYGTEAQRMFTGNHTITLKHTGASLDWAVSGKLQHGLILNNFTGTVILDGLNFNTAANKSAIMILGSSNCTIKIKGENRLSTNKGGVASTTAAIETYNGTKLTITDSGGGSTVDKLYAQATNSTEETAGSTGNGAAIGISNRTTDEIVAGITIPSYPLVYVGTPPALSSIWGIATQVKSTIIIKGGYVDAQAGWHGAGIGGAHQQHYIGDIVISGQDTVVESRGGSHGAGIGGGCYNNTGVKEGSVIVVNGAKVSATSTSAKGSLGSVGNFLFFTDNADTTLEQKLVSKITIKTEDDQANAKLYLDLSAAENVKAALASAGISGDALKKVYFGTTDGTGLATKYGYLTEKVNVVLDDDLKTTKGYEYLPAQVGPATATGTPQPTVDAVINVPKHEFLSNSGNNLAIDYGYNVVEAGAGGQVFTIENTKNASGVYEYAKIPTLKYELTGADADKLEIVPVSGASLPSELPMDGNVQVKIVPKVPTGAAYPVGTYNAILVVSSVHDENTSISGVQNTIPEIEKAFTLEVKKRNLTDGNNSFIKIEADPPTGSKRNLATHDVKLSVTNLTNENITKKEYRILKNGTEVKSWTDFTGSTNITALFQEIWGVNPSYKIEVNAISDNVDIKTSFNYDVDMERPKVTTITHNPTGLQTLGVMDKEENFFTLTFSEAIDFTSFNLSDFITLDKFTVTTPPSSTGATTVKFGIKVNQSVIQSGDTVELKIKENIVNDLYDNPSLSSDQSGTGGNTGLIYNSGEPYAVVNEISPSLTNPTLFKTYVKTLTIDIFSNDDTNSGIIYKDSGASNPITAADFAPFLEVKDKSGNVAYTITNITPIAGGKGQKVTVEFSGAGLDTNDYTLNIKANTFFNAQGKEVEVRAYKFTVRIPKIDLTANDTAVIDTIYFDQKGGSATVTVKGEELTFADSFVLKDTTGKLADITQKATSDTSVIFTVVFPENTDYNTINNYMFTVDMNNAVHTPITQTAVVTHKGNESAGQATIAVDRTKSIVEFDLKGGQCSVQTITADKDLGNVGGKFDFSKYDYEKTDAPTKKDHMFIGWFLNEGRVHNALDLTGAGKGGKYTLVAKWLDISTVIDGNDDDSNGAIVQVDKPTEDTAKYPDEATVADIEKELGGLIVIVPDPGDLTNIVTMKPEFVWDNEDVSTPSVKEITVFIKNPQTGEMVEQPGKLYIYITAKAYISSRNLVMFELDEPTNGSGAEWSPIVVEEVPDYTNKTIVRKLHNNKLVFNPNGFTTRGDGDYTVKFNATITTYRGHEFVVPEKPAAGKVFPFNVENYNAAVARQDAGNEMDFWRIVSEKIHTSSISNVYGVDKNNYKFGGDTPRSLTAKSTGYDREIVAVANDFPMMSSQVFEELTLKENNTKLTVNYGNIKWEFYSQDFKKLSTNPSGFFNLKYKEGNNNKGINALLGAREQQQLEFEMNNSFVASGTLTVNLSKSLSEKSNLNLFYYNEATKKLELIGAMVKNQNNTASIKLKEVRGTYVIVSGLSTSGSNTTAKTTKNNSTTNAADKNKVLSYRITELTDLSDDKFAKEVEKDLASSGKTIKSISVLDADEKTLSNLDKQEYTPFVEKNASVMVAVLSAVAILLVGSLVYFVLLRKKEDTVEVKIEKDLK